MRTLNHEKPMINTSKSHTLFLFTTITALLIYFTSHADAATVTGAYKSVTSNNTVFSITVGTPAPSSLIIQNHHTPGVKASATQPSASKVNYREGTAKWFLKNTRPGNYTFSITFAGPVSLSDTYLILRYRDPATGNFQETRIRP